MKLKIHFTMVVAFALTAMSSFGQTTLPDDVVRVGDREFRFGQPINLDSLNTAGDEDTSSISTDGLTLFFDSTRAGGVADWDLWMSTRSSASSPWGPPVNLGSPINSSYSDGNPRISGDGLTLYFDSDRPGGFGGSDIWMAKRPTLASDWGTPINLGSPANSAYDDGAPGLSTDELTLIFSSNRPGGPGGFTDLWMSTRTSLSEPWSPPVNLGSPVNSSSTESYPCLAPDGLLLFFLSSRTSEPNGNAWVAKRATTSSPFGAPVHIEAVGGTSFRVRPHALSADGTTLYYSSFDRTGGRGGWDLWQISLTALPQIRGVTATSNGEIQFDLLGREGANYAVQTSADLQTWTPWITTNTIDQVRLTDSAPPNQARRFYRAVTP